MTDAPKRRPLADIAEDIYRLLQDCEGDITACEAQLDALQLEHADKCEAYCVVLTRLEAEQNANLELMEHYQRRADARKREHASLKERLKQSLLTTGTNKLKCATTTVWLQETTSLELGEDWALRHSESGFVVADMTYKPLKSEIKNAIERGEDVPDARLVTNRHVRFS